MLVGRHARSLAKIPSGTEIAAIVSCANLMRAAHSLFRFVSGLFELLQDVTGILITFLKDWRKRYWSPVSDEIKLRSDKPLICQSSLTFFDDELGSTRLELEMVQRAIHTRSGKQNHWAIVCPDSRFGETQLLDRSLTGKWRQRMRRNLTPNW